MSEIGKVIDLVATDALAAPLKAAGYQKAGRTWRRHVGDAIQVVNVQASRWNAGADGRFYLNAGVYFPALAARLALFPPTDAPAESACHVRIRPMPQGRRWWEVRAVGVATGDQEAGRILGTVFAWLDRRADRRGPQTNARTTRELGEALDRYALPWLARMADLRATRDELARQGPRWWAAAASLELGERDEAVRLFAEAIAQAPPAHADELLAWGRTNGLER